MKVKFGPSGVPIQCKSSSTIDGIKCCSELGLDAMELQFGMGVRMKKEKAEEIFKVSKKYNISLSCHAPYFVNLCSPIKSKVGLSKANLISATNILSIAGGTVAVFHPGFYQEQSPSEAYQAAKKNLKDLKKRLDEKQIKALLGVETVGKKTAFGGLTEVLQLSKELPFIKPVLDLAHIHAREDHTLKSKEDYEDLFKIVEKSLPDYLDNFHFHFSEINYTDKGERNHFPLGTNNTPPYKPLMKVLKENGYSGTIICETPKLDIDAITMRDYYKKC